MLKAYERQHAVDLIKRTWSENALDEWVDSQEKIMRVWAAVTPILCGGQFQGLYRFDMHKMTTRNARHACANAILWNRKVLNIIRMHEMQHSLAYWVKEGNICRTMDS